MNDKTNIDVQWQLVQDGVQHVAVTVVGRRGSVPQSIGAKAIVTLNGLHWGTVGGGKAEAFAIAQAQAMLDGSSESKDQQSVVSLNLNRDLGMTCGGEVTLLFEVFARARPWRVAMFGAGHVAQALVRVLAKMRCDLTVFDPRPEWTARLPQVRHVKVVTTQSMADEVAGLAIDSQVVVVTQGHITDVPVLAELLARDGFPFVGAIGSKTKSMQMRKKLVELGLTETQVGKLICPIGLPVGNNDPEEIAISIASQLLWYRDRQHQAVAQKWSGTVTQEGPWAN